MAFNGSGTFSRLFNWVTDKGNAVPVTASRMDSEMDGIATGLSTAICKDGQTVTTLRIPFVLGTSAMQGAPSGVSYSFTNDVDTGIYSPTTDSVALAAGGVQVLSSTPTTLSVPIAMVITGSAFFGGTFTVSATATAGYFNGMGAMPVGAIMDYAGSSAPSGWLLCFGQSLVRATYPALFTAIGTTYGAADGTHFTLPDCRGRVLAGKDDMGGSAASRITTAGSSIDGTSLGAAGGAQNVTLARANLPNVQLTVTGTTQPKVSGVAIIAPTTGAGQTSIHDGTGGITNVYGAGTFGVSDNTALDNGATASINGGVTQTVVNEMPPAIILNKIIFAGV